MLNLSIHPSQKLIWLVTLLYVVTGLIGLFLPLSWWNKGILMILHIIHFYIVWYYVLSLKASESIVYVSYARSSGWVLRTWQGVEYKAVLQHGSFCTQYCAFLSFKTVFSQQSHTVIIFPDSLTPEAFRKLRQVLFWGL